ncbi:hypothetical protein KI387_006866, partial [Taxus chinensis]
VGGHQRQMVHTHGDTASSERLQVEITVPTQNYILALLDNNITAEAPSSFHGRIIHSMNYNYIQAGNAIGFDGLHDPDIVARNATLSFETAIWFWMTAQSPKPSSHEVMIGTWNPSWNDEAAGRKAGYGLTTNIINGGLECGYGENDKVKSRLGFYQRYCNILGVSEGTNLDCYNQRPYGLALSIAEEASIIKTVV